MIYTYTYMPHRIDGFHSEIAHFFEELFNNNPLNYSEALLTKDFTEAIKASGKFIGYLESIVVAYNKLDAKVKGEVTNAFANNSDIKNLCNDITCNAPIKYSEISNGDFRDLLKEFFNYLWRVYPFVDAVENKYGTKQEHFNAFIKQPNQIGKVCPFCGIHGLKPPSDSDDEKNRNAYDHFLAKGLYPFVSINFENLGPVCHECNSDEKGEYDILYNGVDRALFRYPYDVSYKKEDLMVTIAPKEQHNKNNFKTLLNDIDWDIAITLAGNDDPSLNSWSNAFNIKTRYKKYLKTHQLNWFETFVLSRYKSDKEDGISFQRFKEKLLKEAKSQIEFSPLGILRYVYFNFILSMPEIENKIIALTA